MRTLGLVVSLALLLSGCDLVHRGSNGSWTRLPHGPLSARGDQLVAWTGEEVLVISGEHRRPCPTSCARPVEPRLRDGAAYDPETHRWRRIASAPTEITSSLRSTTAFAAGRLFVGAGSDLLVYDVDRDAWSTVPLPDGFSGGILPGYTLTAAGTKVVLAASRRDAGGSAVDRVYDPTANTWSTLPPDPVGRAYERRLTAIPGGMVLTARHISALDGVMLAARYDEATSTWTRLPDGDQLSGVWAWTGSRLVNCMVGTGPTSTGRKVRFGGSLDPASGIWSKLPHAPSRYRYQNWLVDAIGGTRPVCAGLLYDDADHTWRDVPRPEDGAGSPGSALWAGDRLVVFGGVILEGSDGDKPTAASWSPDAWISAPGGP